MKKDYVFWLCGSVVHHHFRLIDGVGGGRSFLGSNFVYRDNHDGIDGA